MTTSDVFNRPVTGDDIIPVGRNKEQAPEETFLPALDTLLDTPGVEAVRWEQYTPYFNDGEPCVFGLGEVQVRVNGAPEDAGDYEDGWITSYGTHYYVYGKFEDGRSNWQDREGPFALEFPDITADDLKAAINKFEEAFRNGHEVLLAREFGDHAQVTATKEGFEVEYYEHE